MKFIASMSLFRDSVWNIFKQKKLFKLADKFIFAFQKWFYFKFNFFNTGDTSSNTISIRTGHKFKDWVFRIPRVKDKSP